MKIASVVVYPVIDAKKYWRIGLLVATTDGQLSEFTKNGQVYASAEEAVDAAKQMYGLTSVKQTPETGDVWFLE